MKSIYTAPIIGAGIVNCEGKLAGRQSLYTVRDRGNGPEAVIESMACLPLADVPEMLTPDYWINAGRTREDAEVLADLMRYCD